MYPTLHETDVMKSVEVFQNIMDTKLQNSISYLRKIRGWSQRELANKAHMSVSQLQRLEYGERKIENISLKTAISLANALGVDVDKL